MPLFSSRRKSEANLRSSAAAVATPGPSSPPLKERNDKVQGVQERSTAARSKSATRAGGSSRPERCAPRLPTKTGMNVPGREAAGARKSSSDSWVLVDDGREKGSRQLPLGAGRLAPTRPSPTPLYATPPPPPAKNPHRESSFGSSSSAHHAHPPASVGASLTSLASPSFYATSSPTSDGYHDSFSLDHSTPRPQQQQKFAPAFSNPSPSASFYSPATSPRQSWTRSPNGGPPLSPSAQYTRAAATTDYSAAGQSVVGLPPSSSFYATSPGRFRTASEDSTFGSPASPPQPKRRSSLMQRMQEESPSVAGGRKALEPSVQGESALQPRNGAGFASHSSMPMTPPRSVFPRSFSPSPASRASSVSPTRGIAAPSTSSISNLSTPTSTPPLTSANGLTQPAYDPLAAFFGMPSPPPSAGRPSSALATSRSRFSPSASDQSSRNLGRGALTATSDEDSGLNTSTDELSPPLPPVKLGGDEGKVGLGSPARISPPQVPVKDAQQQERNSTPTQPRFQQPEVDEVSASRPLPTGSTPPPLPRKRDSRSSFSQSTKAVNPASISSSTSSARTRRESLTSTASSGSRCPAPTHLPTSSPNKLVKQCRSGSASLAPRRSTASPEPPLLANPASTVPPSQLRERKPPLPSKAEPLGPASPRQASALTSQQTALETRSRLPTASTQPAARFLPARVPHSAPPEPSSGTFVPHPSSANEPVSPRTPRTPKSPRPPPLDLTIPGALVGSPTGQTKKVTTEGTARAVALAAAREREKKAVGEPEAEPEVEKAPLPADAETQRGIEEDRPLLQPRFEFAFVVYPQTILKAILPHIAYGDLVSLQIVSRTLKRCLETDGKELVLERFLGAHGYRSFAFAAGKAAQTRVMSTGASFLPADNLVVLDLRDLSAFRAGLSLSLDDYSRFSRAYASGRLSPSALNLARASTRAWNRVVLRLRSQALLPASAFAPPAFPALRPAKQPVFKTGRAPSLRVWVPTAQGESWMNDAEVVECEREVWRSGKGVWAQLKKGDVVTNVAIEAFGNVGRMLFDGRFLRDLSYGFDVVGHLPNWLNMLSTAPSYYHNIVVASTASPVFFLSLSPFVSQLRESLTLCSDRVSLSSPQGNYQVRKHVYRGAIKIKPGHIIGSSAGAGGTGPGGIEVVHDDWAGQVVLETEGTTEHATLLIARVASVEPTPWRIMRERCRPGKLWLRPVLDSEAC
ncbi:hypothetical protein JCM21900_005266 [Sporobolomyces salmonicolor]